MRQTKRDTLLITKISHIYHLDEGDSICVFRHYDCVSLFGGDSESHEFCIDLLPEHLPILVELVLELGTLQALRKGGD